MTKSGREIMEIFEAYDLTGTAWSAAQLTGCDAKTVARYVAVRDAGGDPLGRAARPRLIDGFMPKIEEFVDRSKGKIRADVAHRKITAMGYRGSERSTRRAVAEVKQAWRAGRRRRYRPWIPEPGMWLQWDWGDGPRIGGRKTQLFSAWLAWSRFRVVIPAWDQQLGTLTWCIDQALRAVGGAPTYLLTDNARTVTCQPIRIPAMATAGVENVLAVYIGQKSERRGALVERVPRSLVDLCRVASGDAVVIGRTNHRQLFELRCQGGYSAWPHVRP